MPTEKYAGIPSGFTQLDELIRGFQKSSLTVLGARPGVGKTELALAIARNVAVDNNQPVAVFSMEMSRNQISTRLLTAEAGIDSFLLRNGHLGKHDWVRVTEAAGVLERAPIYIDDSSGLTPTELRDRAGRLKKEKDINLVIIDSLQLMKTDHSKKSQDLEDLSGLPTFLKTLAKELDVPILVCAQLRRPPEQSPEAGPNSNNDTRPLLAHLPLSCELEQKADMVIFIYRDKTCKQPEGNAASGIAEILVAKNRYGPVGEVCLEF